MIKRTVFFFLFLTLCLTGIFGQNPWVIKGDRYYERGDYQKAIEYYEWALRKENITQAWSKLGSTFLKINEYEEAERCFRNASEAADFSPQSAFQYGQTLMAQSNYKEAKYWFEKAGQGMANDPRYEAMVRSAGNFGTLLQDSAQMRIEIASFNSGQSDFCPMFYNSGIVFSSSRKFNLGVVYTSKVNGQPLLDLFYTEPGKKDWKRPVPFSFSLNTRFNEGPVAFSPDENTIYFTRNNSKGKEKGNSDRLRKLKIYSADKEGDKFKNVKDLGLNLPGYASGHPAITPDGNYLIFVSDRPGGSGGTDLYRIQKNGEGWSEAENLGPGVNTPGNEMFPWVHPDGSLYFSSDGLAGLGELDIFVANPTAGKWSNPRNLAYPINSSYDDFGLIFAKDRKTGFFSSNRNGGKFNDDIYAIYIDRPAFDCTPQEENNYCVIVYETNSLELNDPADGSSGTLVYEWDLGNGVFKRGLEVGHCFPGPGYYDVKLNVVDSISGFPFFNFTETVVEIKDHVQPYILGPEVVEMEKEASFSGIRSNLPEIDISQYFWEFGDGASAEGMETTHSWMYPGDYTIQLGIIGTSKSAPEQEVLACRTRTIRVVEPEKFKVWTDSIGIENRKRELADASRIFEKLNLPDTNSVEAEVQAQNQATVIAHINTIKENPDPNFTVKITESDKRLPKNAAAFKGIKGVMEFKTEDGYTYTVGNEKDLKKLQPLWSKVVTLGYDDAVVVAFKGKHLIENPDSFFFLNIPGMNKMVTVTFFEGKLQDANGNPVPGDLTVEDLTTGKIFKKVPTDSTGNFYLQLPNGKMYGYFAEKEGFYPVSDYVDLTEVRHNSKMLGTMTTVSLKDMIEKGSAVKINNLFFDPGKSSLRQESHFELDRLARILNENAGLSVEVSGHTDDVGDENYNMNLSLMRSKNVVKYLVLAGFNVQYISFVGFGEERPIAPNQTEVGRKLNRRVEFKFIK